MTDIYIEISKLTDKFREMCYGLTNDENKVNESVQELMLYFLQMNKETLKIIWEKDGKKGILRYGAVALKRALTSTRSNFYYKYEKYYTHIDGAIYNTNTTLSDDSLASFNSNEKNIYNLPNHETDNTKLEKLELIDKELDKIDYWYDRELFKLYYSGETLDSLAEKTGISRNSIFTTIDKVRTIIKKELNEDV
tara:strand:+ start:293 stop:874 length:582 start_codon:yes stop_codon:yes gene_type:complete